MFDDRLDASVMERIAEAARVIRGGGVVCFPTETTYGLAVDPNDPAAIARVLELKGRPERETLALIACDAAQARQVTAEFPAQAARLADEHWPGPLTLVLPARDGLHPALLGPDGGVGVRVSSHGWARALARVVGTPITATSANLKGQPAACTADQARHVFGDGVGCYLDDGVVHEPGASTVARVTWEGRIEVLRAGPIDV